MKRMEYPSGNVLVMSDVWITLLNETLATELIVGFQWPVMVKIKTGSGKT